MPRQAFRLNSASVAGRAPQWLPHWKRPAQSPVTQCARAPEVVQPVRAQTRASQWSGRTTLTLPPGGSRQPVALMGCFGSAATAGQIVRLVRLTIVSRRCPARRSGFGTTGDRAGRDGRADGNARAGSLTVGRADGTAGASAAGVDEAAGRPLTGRNTTRAATRPSAQAQTARMTTWRELFRCTGSSGQRAVEGSRWNALPTVFGAPDSVNSPVPLPFVAGRANHAYRSTPRR